VSRGATTLGQKIEAVLMLVGNSNNEPYLQEVGRAFLFREAKDQEVVLTIGDGTPYWTYLLGNRTGDE
jgi:hypothetical protein